MSEPERDLETLHKAMYVLSRWGRADGASICAAVITEIRAGMKAREGAA